MVTVAESGRIWERRNLAAARDGLESSTASVTRRSAEQGCLTTRTEHGAIDATCRETLPSKKPLMSLSPLDPMRIRSALQRRACCAMVDAMGP